MDLSEWDARIDALYETEIDEARPVDSVAVMREFLADHPDAGALIAFELAGVHDSLGLEEEAVPLYREALAEGLDPAHEPRARIQLASTLRNLGQLDEAIDLLTPPCATDDEPARRAFLALALHSAGRHDEALRQAIEGLVPSLPHYGRSLAGYAADLTDPHT